MTGVSLKNGPSFRSQLQSLQAFYHFVGDVPPDHLVIGDIAGKFTRLFHHLKHMVVLLPVNDRVCGPGFLPTDNVGSL